MEIDCGDNSCLFARSKTGMRTNGGCRCFANAGFHRSATMAAKQMLPELLQLRARAEGVREGQRQAVDRGLLKAVADEAVSDAFDAWLAEGGNPRAGVDTNATVNRVLAEHTQPAPAERPDGQLDPDEVRRALSGESGVRWPIIAAAREWVNLQSTQADGVREERERLEQECGDYRRHIEFAVRTLEAEGNGQPSRCLDRLRRILHHYDHLHASARSQDAAAQDERGEGES